MFIRWQYCKDPNVINEAIAHDNTDWDGLHDASQIISISWDANQGCYVVFWRTLR